MKRTAVSVVAAIMVMYTVYLFGPNTSQETLTTQTIAQEPAAAAGRPDPFNDPSDSKRKSTPPAATAAKKGDQPTESSPRKPAKSSDAGSHAPKNATEYIEAKLAQEGDHEYPDTALQDMVDKLCEKLGIPIVIDKKALEEAGIGTDKTINMHLRGFRTDKFLDLVLSELELTWFVRDGYVLITTKEKLESLLEVRVYNCSDLIEMVKPKAPKGSPPPVGGFFGVQEAGPGVPPRGAAIPGSDAAPVATGANPVGGVLGLPGAAPGGSGLPGVPGFTPGMPPMSHFGGGVEIASQELVPDTASLIELIQTTLASDSWAEAGGYGSIASYHGGLLVINHDGPTHSRIETLLNMMRQAKQAEPGTVVRER